MSRYTTLYIDLDNTLLDFYAAEKHAVSAVFEKHGVAPTADTVALYSKTNKKYWRMFEKGEMSKQRILVERFRETLRLLGLERDPVKMNADYFIALSDTYFLIDGAKDILVYLKSKGYKIYITTNGLARTQYKRISGSGLGDYFDGVFVSETAGSQKPARGYFDYVAANTPEKDKRKILLIGDSMTSDIKGGADFGLDTCWFNAFGEEKTLEPTYEIKELAELKKIL